MIYENVPKLIRWAIPTIIILPIVTYIIVQLITNQPINIEKTKIIYLLMIVTVILIIGFILGAMKVIKKNLNEDINNIEIKNSTFIAAPMMAFYTKNKGN